MIAFFRININKNIVLYGTFVMLPREHVRKLLELLRDLGFQKLGRNKQFLSLPQLVLFHHFTAIPRMPLLIFNLTRLRKYL